MSKPARLIGLALFAASAALAGPALAGDTMSPMYANTATVTSADGTVTKYYFNEDGSFTTDGDLAGAWTSSDDQLCLIPTGSEDQLCATVGAEKRSVGDTYEITTSDGSIASVTLEAGR